MSTSSSAPSCVQSPRLRYILLAERFRGFDIGPAVPMLVRIRFMPSTSRSPELSNTWSDVEFAKESGSASAEFKDIKDCSVVSERPWTDKTRR